jgi:hypothetical protein
MEATFFYVLPKVTFENLHISSESIVMHHVRTVYYVTLMSLPPHKFAILVIMYEEIQKQR